jgi:NRAMP (natural resistance-associated macrophage protein)-like metal ion transporter
MPSNTEKHPEPRKDFLSSLGPGLTTGAADDDPSGISTYSVSGATFGYSLLWMVLLTFPLMAAVQLMCARLGMVTGRGLAGNVRLHYAKWVLWGACALLLTANTINIGADLAGMSEAVEMVTGVPSLIWTPVFTAIIISLLLWSSYRHIAKIFKWLTLVLFAYIGAAFLSRPDWKAVAVSFFVPHLELSAEYVSVFVAIFGTTISPYLFFWQAAQEVEEERAQGRRTVPQRRGATAQELGEARNDTLAGMFFSNLIWFFITVTTGTTLHLHGITHITTARQAAEALRPLAGNAAYGLFTVGLIGTGMLGVPVLAGSSAYAISEAAKWRGSLEDKPRKARHFYAVVFVSMTLGMLLDYAGFQAVSMLFWTAVINGVLAPPLILLVLLLTNNKKVMQKHVNPPLLKWFGLLTVLVMSAAAVALITLAIGGRL